MQKLIILLCLFCFASPSKAQNKCDSLPGKWVFTRWQTDHLLLDIEDSLATIQNKLQKYKEANNGVSMSKGDSLEMVMELSEMLNTIRKEGFISFSLNKDKTYRWKGTVNDPNEQFSGTYSCNGNTITFLSKQNKNDKGTEQITLQLISYNKNRITVVLPPSNDPNFKNNRMSFKRVQ